VKKEGNDKTRKFGERQGFAIGENEEEKEFPNLFLESHYKILGAVEGEK